MLYFRAAKQPDLTLTAKEVSESSHLQKSMGLTQIKQAHVRKRYLLGCIRRRRRRRRYILASARMIIAGKGWHLLMEMHGATGSSNPFRHVEFIVYQSGFNQRSVTSGTCVIVGLSQGIGSHDCGRWLGSSKTHRAGCLERQAARQKLRPTHGVSSSGKPELCL